MAAPVAAETLDRLRDSGEIRLGHRTDAIPLSYVDADGQPQGYSVLVCRALVAKLADTLGVEKLTPVWVPLDAQNRFDAVAEGRVDLHCGAATITLSRRERVDFSIPTFVDGTAVLLAGEGDTAFEDLAGKRLGVRGATTTEEILRNSLEAEGLEAEVVPFRTFREGVAALSKGDIDAFFGDQSQLFGLASSGDLPEGLRISENTLTVEKHGLVLQRGDSDFRLAVDRALSAMYQDGEMARIFRAGMPGIEPGVALKMLFILAPEVF
ncbi:amino acid ABC transporter substrate-binding protein [Thioalkalivibrio sp.]|uniref:amino acid ABC transporter substrate-binding protein n=1 Tax=Thioalkalivibrio sp. TaxID=2093813 RepID=UPI0025D2E9D1|nr:amino acid ABC transporter substrate-binding protein [Thioalkalivibrio sp.]